MFIFDKNMFYLDNSETSWLVYADWLEDQDIDATHIRELNPITNEWHHERSSNDNVGTILVRNCVGSNGGSTSVGLGDSQVLSGVGSFGHININSIGYVGGKYEHFLS